MMRLARLADRQNVASKAEPPARPGLVRLGPVQLGQVISGPSGDRRVPIDSGRARLSAPGGLFVKKGASASGGEHKMIVRGTQTARWPLGAVAGESSEWQGERLIVSPAPVPP